jgi:glycerate-2-kinase
MTTPDEARAADADAILRAAITAADPAQPLRTALLLVPEIDTAASITLLAIGKAACRMRDAALALLGSRIHHALTIVPHGTTCDDAVHASHPIPDASSEQAARLMRDAVLETPPDALLLVLLSGGASSLVVSPEHSITIADYAHCVTLLQRAGADIHQLNIVRKHIDRLKGGRLAALATPRSVVGALLSDVISDAVDTIASGPLSADPSTFRDALDVLHTLDVWSETAASVRSTLERGAAGVLAETPKRAADIVNARTIVIGGNALARDGAAAAAAHAGYRIEMMTEPVTGEARRAARHFCDHALGIQRRMHAGGSPCCLIAGGETTVTVRGAGRGGRNLEFALAAALALEGTSGITIGSVGTDGVDGSSDAAGAIASDRTIDEARGSGLDAAAFLKRNDSDAFFRAAGHRIVTGPTGTNVMDVQIALITALTRA